MINTWTGDLRELQDWRQNHEVEKEPYCYKKTYKDVSKKTRVVKLNLMKTQLQDFSWH